MSALTELIRHSRQSHTGRPLHECIEDALHRGLHVGQLKPGQKITLVDEVAHQWNVSRATVQQSMQVLAAKGIVVRRPRAGTFLADMPMQLGNGVSRSVSVVIPDIQMSEFAGLARGVEDAAHEQGLSVVVCSTDHDPQRYAQALTRQIEARVFGIFMVPPLGYALPIDLVSRLHSEGIPVVTCFRSLYELTGWPMIRTDGFYGMHLMAAHFAEIGRKRIGFCGFAADALSSDKEQQMGHYGFLMGLLEHGLSPNPQDVLMLPRAPMSSADKARNHVDPRPQIMQWITAHPYFDAICCAHDQEALMIMDVLKKLGKRVPGDVAVSGTGNWARQLGIGPHDLTTIDFNATEFGRQFCRLAREMRANPGGTEPAVIEVRGELIVGRSTVGDQPS